MSIPDPQAEDSIASISDYLKKEFELDEADVDEMLGDYLSNLKRLVKEAQAALDAKDRDALRKAGHAVKGVAGNVGSPAISANGKIIEDGAKAGAPFESLAPALQAISRQHEQLEKQKSAS